MSRCKHTTTVDGEHFGFTGSVAHYPYTDENPCAHGNVRYTETCASCGAERSVNCNQRHYEYSPWGPSRREQQRAAEAAEIEALAELKRQIRAGRPAVQTADITIRVVAAEVDEVKLAIERADGRSEKMWLSWAEIKSAAEQVDPMLAGHYTAILNDAKALRA